MCEKRQRECRHVSLFFEKKIKNTFPSYDMLLLLIIISKLLEPNDESLKRTSGSIIIYKS